MSTYESLIAFEFQVKTVLVEFTQCSSSKPFTSAGFLPKGTKTRAYKCNVFMTFYNVETCA